MPRKNHHENKATETRRPSAKRPRMELDYWRVGLSLTLRSELLQNPEVVSHALQLRPNQTFVKGDPIKITADGTRVGTRKYSVWSFERKFGRVANFAAVTDRFLRPFSGKVEEITRLRASHQFKAELWFSISGDTLLRTISFSESTIKFLASIEADVNGSVY